MLSFERLKELKDWVRSVMKFGVSEGNEIIVLIDEAIARQSVTSEEVQREINRLTDALKQTKEAAKELKEQKYAVNMLPVYDQIKSLELQITALQAYQPWVSVNDRLPERGDHYLCCEDDIMAIFVAYYGASGWQRPLYRETNVTHWKPLPEPPKGE